MRTKTLYVRVPDELHGKYKAKADELGTTLNGLVVSALSAAFPRLTMNPTYDPNQLTIVDL